MNNRNRQVNKKPAAPHSLERKSLGQYCLEELLLETGKKLIFRGRHNTLPGDFCIKVLKPDMDREKIDRFTQESQRLTQLDHPNIERIFDAGIDKGNSYLVSRFIDGHNLDQSKKFSLKEIKAIADTTLEALQYAYERGCEHSDVKPANIMITNQTEEPISKRIRIIDFGPWYEQEELRNHVAGTAITIQTLLDNRVNENTPRSLKKILKIARNQGYETPGELRKAIKGVTRRKVLAGGTAIALATIFGYTGNAIVAKRDSLTYVVGQIRKTDSQNYKRMDSLLAELGEKIAYQKILRLYENKRITNGEVPFATDTSKRWVMHGAQKSTAGRWVSCLESAHNITGDKKFENLKIKTAEQMRFNRQTERGFEPVRCLHVGIDIAEAAKYFDGEYGFFDENIGFYDVGAAFANRFKAAPTDAERIISINSLDSILPLILTAAERKETARYHEHVIRHTELAARLLIRDNGSTRDLVKFNKDTGEIVEGNYYSIGGKSCPAFYHASAIDWFARMHEITGNEDYKTIAQETLNFYTSRLRNEFIPLFDLANDPKDTKNKPQDMPLDTAAAARICVVLKKRNIVEPEKQKEIFYRTMHSLVTSYVDTSEESEVILGSMCSNYRTKSNMEACITRGLDSFLEAITLG